MMMRFLTYEDVRPQFEGRRVCIVGSGPGVLDNPLGLIDGHDIVVRVNSYKLIPPATGERCDVHYSFYGHSVRVSPSTLVRDGVRLCLCKCPDADRVIESEWHRRNKKDHGIDFAWIYRMREQWWFCDVYIPSAEIFMEKFHLLGGHIPTTGFAAILDVLSWRPATIYLTGFDGFTSGMHNINEKWGDGDPNDPIRHVPERELAWLQSNRELFSCDPTLQRLLSGAE